MHCHLFFWVSTWKSQTEPALVLRQTLKLGKISALCNVLQERGTTTEERQLWTVGKGIFLFCS